VFVVAYAVVRFSHLAVYALAAGDDSELRRTIGRAFVATLPAMVLLGVGVAFDQRVRLVLWAVAVLIDYIGIFVTSATGWRLPAPGHFAERHQLVVIIAIGESIVSVGVGLGDARLSWSLLAGALLGIAISIALWWTYFDVVAIVAARVLSGLHGDDRTRLGRDTFTYLHLPVVTGIVYLALGLKLVLGQAVVNADGGHAVFSGAALLALYGGCSLYLLAMSVIRWRDVGSLNVERLAGAAALMVIGLLAGLMQLTGLVNLLLVCVAMVALVGYEAVHFKEARASIRAEAD
jgi:low temperature requirement protein LtrA